MFMPDCPVETGASSFPNATAFRLMMSAQAKWRKLDGTNRLPEVVRGVEFKDGIKQLQAAA